MFVAYEEVYSEEETRNFLLSAGQFAHVSESGIDAFMGREFSSASKKRGVGQNIECQSVTYEMWKMATAFGSPKTFILSNAFFNLERDCGVLCCICGDVGPDDGRLVDGKFVMWACPTFVPVKEEADGEETFLGGALCTKCSRRVRRKIGHLKGDKLDDGAFVSALKYATEDPAFFDRVRENSVEWANTRFDPRKPR